MLPQLTIVKRYTVTQGVLEYSVPFPVYEPTDVMIKWSADNLGEAVSQEELDELNALLGDVERAATEQMDAATLKDRKKRLAEFRKIAAEALEQEPFWQAVDYLSGKDIGLNRELLEVDYGKDSVRDLMRVKRSLVRSKGGVQLDVVATELGYPDADTLWNEMQDRLVAGGQTKQGEINRRAQEMLDAEDAHIVENVDEMAGEPRRCRH